VLCQAEAGGGKVEPTAPPPTATEIPRTTRRSGVVRLVQ
jgi:hypothetical protein